jgi:hypothetical protein
MDTESKSGGNNQFNFPLTQSSRYVAEAIPGMTTLPGMMLKESIFIALLLTAIFLCLRFDKSFSGCACSFSTNNAKHIVINAGRINDELFVYECLKLQFIAWLPLKSIIQIYCVAPLELLIGAH